MPLLEDSDDGRVDLSGGGGAGGADVDPACGQVLGLSGGHQLLAGLPGDEHW